MMNEADDRPGRPITGVKPFVTDSRNLLIFRPGAVESSQEFLTTLLYALKRGMQFVYQVEEQEIAAELIGQGEHQRLMFWEAAEGGTGISERLFEEPDAMAMVAKRALQVCRFEPDDPDSAAVPGQPCVVACYECLLSYANQSDHRLLDRRMVHRFLAQLAFSRLEQAGPGRFRDEQYQLLRSITDPKSAMESAFLDFLYQNGYRLPDTAQNRPCPDVSAQPDFYYERGDLPGVCVFIDGSAHDHAERSERDAKARQALAERGYRIIALPGESSFLQAAQNHEDIFGVVGSSSSE